MPFDISQVNTPEILQKYNLQAQGSYPAGGVKNFVVHKVVDRATGNVTGFKLGYQMDFPSAREPVMGLYDITPEQASAFQGLGIPISEQWGGLGSGYTEMGTLPLTGYPEYIPQVTTVPGQAASTAPLEITPYMQSFRTGTAAGQTPTQISQQYAGTATPATLGSLGAATPALGKKIEGFPQTQAQMAEWQQKYVFDSTTRSWYEKPIGGAGVGTGAGIGTGAGASAGGGIGDNSQAVLDALANYTGTTVIPPLTAGNDLQAILDWLSKTSKDPYTQYTELREKLGIPTEEKKMEAVDIQIQKTNQLLDELERNLQSRISGKLITQPAYARELAVERRPLTEELSKLIQSQGIVQTGLTGARQQLSDLLSMYGKETPQQKLAEMIMQQEVAQQYKTPTPEYERYMSVQGGLYDPVTKQWVVPPKETTTESNIDIYAQDVLAGRISLSSVPDKIQTQVSAKVDELSKTMRFWEDEEIRAKIRQAYEEGWERPLIIQWLKSQTYSTGWTQADTNRAIQVMSQEFPT